MAKRIAVVDDEKDILELVSYALTRDGFEVATFSDGHQALTEIRKGSFDLLILDLMLPAMGGLEVCRAVRNDEKISTLPIVMLTAKSDEVDRIIGLEMGADDYVTKPFSPRELVARVKAVLRRGAASPGAHVLQIGDIEISPETYTVVKRGVRINLSATEFRLLLSLAEKRGKVFTREMLLDAAWSSGTFVEPRTVDVHIRRLRAQIEDNPEHPEYILTKRGVGYYMDDTA
ncbi:MAG: response regulator [Thermodesulfovibrionales bacterium]